MVGAGIGGLAAAIGLRRVGLDVEVVEAAGELRDVGAGLTLWPNAIRALDWLGLGGTVRALGSPDVVGAGRTWNGELLTAPALGDLVQRFGAPALALHRADLQTLLLDALGREHVHLGRRCVGFEQRPDGVVVRLADRSAVDATLLIGADGLHSAVRSQLHGDVSPRYAGYTAWRAVVRFDHRRLKVGESWGYGARFGQLPLREGRVYWFATQNAPEGARARSGEKQYLGRLFGAWHDPIPDLIEAAAEDEILHNDIYDRSPLREWGRGRVTLLGDAAHPMTPNLGQGACQALEDAVVLAGCLRDATEPAALREYERRRFPRTSELVRLSRQVGQVAQLEFPLAVRLRNLAVRHVLPRFQTGQLARVLTFSPPAS